LHEVGISNYFIIHTSRHCAIIALFRNKDPGTTETTDITDKNRLYI